MGKSNKVVNIKRGNMKMNLTQIRNYDVSLDPKKEILIVEAKPYLNFFDGSWLCEDLRDMGHELQSFKLSVLKKDDGRIKPTDKVGGLKIIHMGSRKIVSSIIKIKSDADFDNLYKKLEEKVPDMLVENKYLFICEMVTTSKGRKFRWARKLMETANDGLVYKLILVQLDGKLPKEISAEDKKNIIEIVGNEMILGECKIKLTGVESVICNGYQ
jgi:hypothetical protein